MELLVVISIMALVSSVVLADFPQFNRLSALERGSQLLALMVRESETYAMSARGSGGVFTNRFGTHMDISVAGNPRQYVFFADADMLGTTNFYDAGEELFIRTLSPQIRINKICRFLRNAIVGDEDCTIERLSITFERPAPTISVFGTMGAGPLGDLGTGDFEIELVTNDGSLARCVVVWSTGTVSIESNSCL